LTSVDFDYVNTCLAVEKLERNRRHRGVAAVITLGLAIAGGLLGWLNEDYLRARLRWDRTIRPYVTAWVVPYVLTAEREHALHVAESFRECAKDCPEMIVVPAGGFTMGSPDGQEGHDKNEGPQHRVIFKYPFAVSKLEVTFDDWDACVAFGDCPRVSDSGWGHGQHPVIHVTWDDAETYVRWIAMVTGKPYRMLSEAEWEYAARAGVSTSFSFGDDPAACDDYAWFVGNSEQHTHPGGLKKANGFGLYDVHGNVWEWTADCYHPSYDGAPTDGSAWMDERSDCIGIARGGGWNSEPRSRATATRLPLPHYSQNYDIGFRLARTLAR
jgi:formylglycine-generating enzyme required for sulfatase activity